MVLVAGISATPTYQPAAKEPYEVAEAYEVYSVVLPHEESYGFAKGTLVIQQDTIQKQEALGPCLTAEAANRFKDAISDFDRLESKSWLLQRKFDFAKPYILVDSSTIDRLFQCGPKVGIAFYKRYPESGGYLTMSPVGFNTDKTQAIVYIASSCGSLCGRCGFHLLERVQGNWKEAPGVSCLMVS